MIRWDDAGGRALQEEMPASESGLVWDIWIMHLHIYIFILIRLLFFIAFLKFNHSYSNDSYSNSISIWNIDTVSLTLSNIGMRV